MKILVTGAAGFIGGSFARRLLDDGHAVIGVDNLNPYYSIRLKRKRLARLYAYPRFEFHQLDLSHPDVLDDLPGQAGIERVVHLAAQAGVRYSMENPFPYVSSNVVGHLSVLEFCRRLPQRPLLIYASSSSVYGQGAISPFREDGVKGEPVSLYAVTKETDELMSRAYASLYGLRQIGLRFFTVYGPWGRPDMAYWLFTRQALLGRPVQLFNKGEMQRDFSYIDDVIDGLSAVTTRSPNPSADDTRHQLYNLGSGRAASLHALVEAVGKATGRPVETELLPMQSGDVRSTCADISLLTQTYGYEPKMGLEEGVAAFVDWFRSDPELLTI